MYTFYAKYIFFTEKSAPIILCVSTRCIYQPTYTNLYWSKEWVELITTNNRRNEYILKQYNYCR